MTLQKMFGTAKDMVRAYLDEHMWHECYGAIGHLAYLNIMQHIAMRYRVACFKGSRL